MKQQPPVRELEPSLVAVQAALQGGGAARHAHAGDPVLALAHQQALACLPAALEKLPPRHRQVVLLHYEQEMAFAAVGRQLGVSEVRAWQLHRDAIARLRCQFHGWGLAETALFPPPSH